MSRRRSHKKSLQKHQQRQSQRHHKNSRKNRIQHARGSFRSNEIVLKARVEKNPKGFAFLIFDDSKAEDMFVNPRQAAALFHGDRVEVMLGRGNEIQDIRVIEHRFRELVGRFQLHPDGGQRGGRVLYERKKNRIQVSIPKIKEKVAENDWVRVKLQFGSARNEHVTGEILEVYGASLPASADISMVAGEFNLIEEHSQEAIAEAEAYGHEISSEESKKRKDLVSVPFITIDGADARDFDDAVYVERNKSGYVLWVGIADVSSYVREGTSLDKEAYSRATSVYFPERAFHMLPRNLSENLCSLKPNVLRLSLVAKMEFDYKGNKKRVEIYDSVIRSRRRATYEEIEKEHQENLNNKNWEYRAHFELYDLLRKVRSDRGSIDFDLPEAKVQVEKNGEVIAIQTRERLNSHRLIEEFMIVANESVTEWMLERHRPFIYRIHEEPSFESLQKFSKLAKNFGFNLRLESGTPPKVFAEFVRKLEGNKGQTLLNMSLLRAMKQAVYSSVHSIHFGLASQAYTHFTSPIRRYPDLVVHRLIKGMLKNEKIQNKDKMNSRLSEIAEHCSYRERLASDAERESIKLKQVRLMSAHIGEEFEGMIMGMAEVGLFVQLPDPYVEGLVSKELIEELDQDFFEFNEERMIFVGKRRKRMFHIGDQMKVRVSRTDLERRLIDFDWIPEENMPTRQKSPR